MEHNEIHFRAEFIIEDGKLEEFKKLAQDMSKVVKANEPDTINYQFYLNKAETMCADGHRALAENPRPGTAEDQFEVAN